VRDARDRPRTWPETKWVRIVDRTTVEWLLDRFDGSFASGDLDTFASMFTDDAIVLFHYLPPVVGRAAIRDAFGEVFEAFDTSDYRSRYHTVETHPGAAYAIGDIVEVLRPRAGGHGTRVLPRLVLFKRRVNGSWYITRLLTARAAPNEDV